MNVDKILSAIGVTSYIACTEIQGGKNSKVFKVDIQPSKSYALRILPFHQYGEFDQEEKMMNIAREHGIPVPIVHTVSVCENNAVMLMDWASGQTLFSELLASPDKAFKLGHEFGKMHSKINLIQLNQDDHIQSWLTPSIEEKEMYNQISQFSENNHLLHLDYHPLNVLTDGEKITAVIDWGNASTGDPRFDFARTYSILQLIGPKLFQEHSSSYNDFTRGWEEGYEQEQVSDACEAYPLFYAWAGLRMKRDMASILQEEDNVKIEKWVTKWLQKYQSNV
jgi:aminoglycoside phosphotransferase (APT) family kinase protein